MLISPYLSIRKRLATQAGHHTPDLTRRGFVITGAAAFSIPLLISPTVLTDPWMTFETLTEAEIGGAWMKVGLLIKTELPRTAEKSVGSWIRLIETAATTKTEKRLAYDRLFHLAQKELLNRAGDSPPMIEIRSQLYTFLNQNPTSSPIALEVENLIGMERSLVSPEMLFGRENPLFLLKKNTTDFILQELKEVTSGLGQSILEEIKSTYFPSLLRAELSANLLRKESVHEPSAENPRDAKVPRSIDHSAAPSATSEEAPTVSPSQEKKSSILHRFTRRVMNAWHRLKKLWATLTIRSRDWWLSAPNSPKKINPALTAPTVSPHLPNGTRSVSRRSWFKTLNSRSA